MCPIVPTLRDGTGTAYIVSERDKGDYNNKHVHMLIGTNTDMSYKEVKHAWIR